MSHSQRIQPVKTLVREKNTFGRRVASLLLLTGVCVAVPSAQPASSWDERYRALPDAGAIGEYMKRLSARPHKLYGFWNFR